MGGVQVADRLAGKVAVVTGVAGMGIGQGVALAFAEGLSYVSFIADLTDPAASDRLMEFAVERFGGIDILVPAAAFVEFAPVEEFDYEKQWKRTLQGELDLVFLPCKAVWRHMVARGGGSIINFASANAYVSMPMGALAHCATKGGVLAMTRQLAMEGAKHHIRANTISPALIVTKHTKERLDHEPGFKELVLKSIMLDRLGTPEDIGHCATYLASDESGWVTGADIKVDGGATAF
jgi:NAD(P)-dependent dehydrogenase (short-subunit alcohol dehydrogenase family)